MFEKNLKHKAVSLFIAVLLLASTIAMLTVSTPINAQTDQQVTVKTFLSVRPATVGLGQEFLINMWFSPAPGANRQYHDLMLVITKPDGSVQEIPGIDTYVADGTMWMTWYPDQVGEWSFQLKYPGEYFAAGVYFDGKRYDTTADVPPPDSESPLEAYGGGTYWTVYNTDATVKPASSPVSKLTVKEEMIPSWPEAPLPTDYWTRPVDEINREWWPILGSYPWYGPARDDPLWDVLYPDTNPTYNSAYAFVPWVTGPESAHVVWKRQYAQSGLMGGDFGGASYINPRTGGSGSGFYDVRTIAPQMIVLGKGYHVFEKPSTGESPIKQWYWECYDIRSGEVFWERPLVSGEATPNIIEWATGSTATTASNVQPNAPELLSISNGYMRKYHAFTGALLANVSIAPMAGSGGTYYMNAFVLGIQDLGAAAGAERYRLINWTTSGYTANFTERVISNTTYARNALPTANLIDWNVGIGCTTSSVNQGGIYVGQNISGFDLRTGVRLWTKYIDEPQASGSACVADHGKVTVSTANGYFIALDLKSGNEVWRTRVFDYPWDASGWGSYSATSGYGQLYWMAQSGIYAIDWNTGAVNWKYEKEAPPFETVFTGSEGQTVYPSLNGGICADGKIYMYLNQHTPEVPFYRGQPTVCVDAFSGEEVWSTAIGGGNDMRRSDVQLAVADGYLATAGRDGYLYVYGKGESETTVSAAQALLTLGQRALITGTVFDLSPAQVGAPCVSKESVAAQMEQYHLGAPVGGAFSGVMMADGTYGDVMLVGVPVSLDVLDPNGNYYNIGMTTSDGYSGTFGYSGWVPEVVGQYTITATFMGDVSYGSSFATTYLVVTEGENTTSDNTLLYALIGATVAIIVVVIACFLIFRKK